MLRETCKAPFTQWGYGGAEKPPLCKGRCHGYSRDGGIVVRCCRYTHKHRRNSDLLRCLVFLLPIDRIDVKNLSLRHHIQALFSQNAVTRQALPQFLPPHSKSQLCTSPELSAVKTARDNRAKNHTTSAALPLSCFCAIVLPPV